VADRPQKRDASDRGGSGGATATVLKAVKVIVVVVRSR